MGIKSEPPAKITQTDIRYAKFAREYLVDGNGTQAAIRAGYSPTSAGSTAAVILADPRTQTALRKARLELESASGVTIAEVVQELRGILLADPGDALAADGAVLPLADWPEPLRRALGGMEVVTRRCKCGQSNDVTKLKWWTKTAASDQLLRHLGGYAAVEVDIGPTLASLIAGKQRRLRDGKDGDG